MKKIITTLLFLFMVLGLFAETGYAGFEWGTNKNNFTDLTREDDYILSEQRVMFNTLTTRYFSFGNGQLWTVSYSLSAEKTEEIKSKFKNQVYKKKITELSDELINEAYQRFKLEENEKNKDYITNKLVSAKAAAFSSYGISETEKEGKATLYAYDYNDDTRVFIFQNITEGKTVVVYSYHEKDS